MHEQNRTDYLRHETNFELSEGLGRSQPRWCRHCGAKVEGPRGWGVAMKVKTANGFVADVVVGIPCYVKGCMCKCRLIHACMHDLHYCVCVCTSPRLHEDCVWHKLGLWLYHMIVGTRPIKCDDVPFVRSSFSWLRVHVQGSLSRYVFVCDWRSHMTTGVLQNAVAMRVSIKANSFTI